MFKHLFLVFLYKKFSRPYSMLLPIYLQKFNFLTEEMINHKRYLNWILFECTFSAPLSQLHEVKFLN